MKYKRLTKRIGSATAIKTHCGGYATPFDADEIRAVDRLAVLEDKIEQGTLIELPCKVGDRVYVIADGIWHCQEVWQFRYDSCGLFVKTVGVYPYDFECGKTVFLTREEAEKRLKELQNGYND